MDTTEQAIGGRAAATVQTGRTRRRLVIAAGTGVAAASVLAACGARDGATQTAAKRQAVELQVSMWASSAQMDALMAEQARKFGTQFAPLQATPMVVTGGGYDEKVIALLAAGTPPDVIEINPDRFADYAAQASVRSIEGHIKRDRQFKLQDYMPEHVSGYRWRNEVAGLPLYNFTFVMFYNRSMFQQAGVKLPADTWTWDDFMAAGQRLTKPEQWGAQLGFGWSNWIGAVWANGGDLLSKDLTKYTLDDPKAIEALQWWADLRAKHKIVPEPNQTGGLNAYDLFVNGKIAMYPWGTSMIPAIAGRTSFDWDVAMIPAGKDGRWHRLGGACFSIVADTKYPDESWDLLKWMVGEDTQKSWSSEKLFAPSLIPVANSKEWLNTDGKPPANLKAFTEMTKHSRFIAAGLPAQNEIGSVLSREFGQVWTGQRTAGEAARAARSPVEEILKTLPDKLKVQLKS